MQEHGRILEYFLEYVGFLAARTNISFTLSAHGFD